MIGIRFTKKERKIIEGLAENRHITITDFIREAVFSHINNLKNNANIIEVDFFMQKFGIISDSIETIENCVKYMKKEFNIYDLTKIQSELSTTEGI